MNEQDIVPKLPPEILGFHHVATEQPFSSLRTVQPSFLCWHELATYLSLIHPALQPDPGCQLHAATSARPVRRCRFQLGRVTVDFTVNVARDE